MNVKLFISIFLVNLIFIKDSDSRPISYSGGWTVMQMNDFNKHSIHLHYTPSIKYSLGYKGEYWRKTEWQFHGIQFNYLIKRFNTSKSQSNFYLKNGVGVALSDLENSKRKLEPNFFTGLSFDWEDKQYFISYENRVNNNNSIDRFFFQKVRVGFAPYIGKYGDLHSWLMLQIDHMPKNKNKLVYTPMLRMFKDDYLVEAGLSNRSDLMINFIKRF